jgi:succinate dehydrogenase/fumarate reductase iron-sulfur protein
VKVNGTPKLACWDEALPEMTIEPLDNLSVVRDLVISRDDYEASLAKLQPLMVRKEAYGGFPEPFTAKDAAPNYHLRDCIQCLACQSVCPVVKQGDTGFAGPALLVQLAELAQDPRDKADRGRIAAEDAQVFKCVSCYECERVCPSEIPIVREAIEPLKRLAVSHTNVAGARRTEAFVESVKTSGRVNPSFVAMKTSGVTWHGLRVALRMALKGKIRLSDAFGKRQSPAAEGIRKTYESNGKNR